MYYVVGRMGKEYVLFFGPISHFRVKIIEKLAIKSNEMELLFVSRHEWDNFRATHTLIAEDDKFADMWC